MGNKKLNGTRIDGGEIEFVSRHPKDHTRDYVKAVREACYRRYRRAYGKDKPPLRYSLRLLDEALHRWEYEARDGMLVPVGPLSKTEEKKP